MNKVLIDRALLERAVYRLELAYDADAPIVCDLSSVLSAPSGTPAMPVKAYYHEALAGYAVRDARIAELELLAAAISADCNDMANERNQLRAELAAIKAQEPAVIECGIDNGDGTYSVSLKRLPLPSYITPHKDWPVKYFYAAPVAKQVVMPNELEEFECWITDESGPHALKKWPTDTALAYENDRVQDYRTGWVECLNRLNAADQEGAQDE